MSDGDQTVLVADEVDMQPPEESVPVPASVPEVSSLDPDRRLCYTVTGLILPWN